MHCKSLKKDPTVQRDEILKWVIKWTLSNISTAENFFSTADAGLIKMSYQTAQVWAERCSKSSDLNTHVVTKISKAKELHRSCIGLDFAPYHVRLVHYAEIIIAW